MSGFAAFEQAIQERMVAEWAAGPYASIPVVYDNLVGGFERGMAPWIALTLQEGDGDRVSLPPMPIERFTGVISAQIFVRKNTGTRMARHYGDAVAEIFRWKQFEVEGSGQITTKTPSIVHVGESDGWYQINVSIPYERDRVNS